MPRAKPGFHDVVLPVFEQPAQVVVPERSKKQQAEDKRVKYTRHSASPRAKCDPCVTEKLAGERIGINDASYLRTSPEGGRYLCFLHTQEQKHLDQLAGLVKNGPA